MAELFSSVVAVDAEALMAQLSALNEKMDRLLEKAGWPEGSKAE